MSCFNSGSITYAEYKTSDIGTTSQVTMSAQLSASYVQLLSTVPSGQAWKIAAVSQYL
jgi:hypothetical protein